MLRLGGCQTDGAIRGRPSHKARPTDREDDFPLGEMDALAAIRNSRFANAAEPLRSLIAQGSEPGPVWPYEQGTHRGLGFEPLYRTAPIAALRDRSFYEYLSLADALRDGRTGERSTAEAEWCRRLRECNKRLKS